MKKAYPIVITPEASGVSVYIPDFDGLKIFNKQVNPMFNIISENTRENQELITLRDWLLPMLMNGQATISD